MKQQWHNINDKFDQLTPREVWLIILTGVVVCIVLPFMLFITNYDEQIKKNQRNNKVLVNNINDLNIQVNTLSSAVGENANIKLKADIQQYEKRIANINDDLLELSEYLINPKEMRSALLSVLTLQKGVSLTSFEVLPIVNVFSVDETSDKSNVEDNAVPEANIEKPLGLYQHTIRMTLHGEYFKLRDYLLKLEGTSWLFYWQQFNYRLIEHPESELRIEIYTLSSEKEFVGV